MYQLIAIEDQMRRHRTFLSDRLAILETVQRNVTTNPAHNAGFVGAKERGIVGHPRRTRCQEVCTFGTCVYIATHCLQHLN